MVHGDLRQFMSWFVVVQYMPVKLKIGVGSLMSHLQLV